MVVIRRGDIIQAKYGENGQVPVLVLSEGIFNQKSGTIVGVALTKDQPSAGYPLSYRLTTKLSGQDLWAKCAQIKTLSTLQLGQVLGHAQEQDLQQIISGLYDVIGG